MYPHVLRYSHIHSQTLVDIQAHIRAYAHAHTHTEEPTKMHTQSPQLDALEDAEQSEGSAQPLSATLPGHYAEYK